MYTYTAHVTSVYDADTFTADIDLGFGTWLHGQKLRLYGINAFEVRRSKSRGIGDDHVAKGKVARDEVRELLSKSGNIICMESLGKGKYGRWLSNIWLPMTTTPGYGIRETRTEIEGVVDYTTKFWLLNDWLTANGHAEVNYYK